MTWNVLEYGPRRRMVEIWNNTDGVTMSRANGVLFTAKVDADGLDAFPAYFTPSGTYAAGTSVLGEAGSASTLTADTITSGPFQSKHIFRIPTEGASRLFIEWRGEVTANSTGFATGAGIDGTVRYFWSTGGAWATGALFDDPSLGSSYLNLPQNICYNSTQYGANAAVMAGLGDTPQVAATNTRVHTWGIVGGAQLAIRSYQTMDTTFTTPFAGPVLNQLNYAYRTQMGKLPNAGGSSLLYSAVTPVGPLSQGGLLWGWTQTSAVASHFPTLGDRLGWVYEIGYPKTFSAYNQSSAAASILMSDLSVKGLGAVYCAFCESAPIEGNDAAHRFLTLTNASMIVRGTIRAILVYDDERT